MDNEEVNRKLAEQQSLKQNLSIQIYELKEKLNKAKVTDEEIELALKKVKKALTKDDIISRRIINNYVEKVLVYADGRIELYLNLPRNFSDKYLEKTS